MTREMREVADREKAIKRTLTQYDVRIRFPDGMQLQGTFSATETIGDIYQFVRDHLALKEAPFQLRMADFSDGEVGWLIFRFDAEGEFGGFGIDDSTGWIFGADDVDV